MKLYPNESFTELTSKQTYNMKDEELRKFTCLKKLELQYNSSITDYGIRDLTNLMYLDLSFQRSITIDGLKNLTNLTSINLVANGNRLFKHARNTHQLKSHKYELCIQDIID
jgi:hypothetical protein